MDQIDSNKPTDRRGFFRQGFASLLGPLADMLEKRLDHVRQSFSAAMPSEERRLLRPPGALPEEQFLVACQSCGRCASSCPVAAIYMRREPGAGEAGHQTAAEPRAQITPVIDPLAQPCVLCPALACMSACPSGALAPTAVERIHIGTAGVDVELCLRSGGQDCRRCIEHCPRGSAAIRIADSGERAELPGVAVQYPGCVGCGVCAFECPAEPKAIVVHSDRDLTKEHT